jgi:hypothetical protein
MDTRPKDTQVPSTDGADSKPLKSAPEGSPYREGKKIAPYSVRDLGNQDTKKSG